MGWDGLERVLENDLAGRKQDAVNHGGSRDRGQ